MLLIPTLLCPMSWERMSGNDRERFCTHCRQPVHNLDALSPTERLALLASPAAKLCSRYKAAIRRPAKGRKDSYTRHLLKYGAAVAVSGGALLTLWEINAEGNSSRRYRVFTEPFAGLYPVPLDDYEEAEVHLLGAIVLPPCEIPQAPDCDLPSMPAHIDIQIDPLQIDQLFDHAKLAPPASEPVMPDKVLIQQ